MGDSGLWPMGEKCVCVLCGLREKKLKEGVGRDG